MEKYPTRVCLSLGSNINPETNIPKAVEILRQYVTVLSISSAWESEPVITEGPDFINVAVLISTTLSQEELVQEVLRSVEIELGRTRTGDKFASRTIDLDVLVWGDQIIESELWDCVYLAVPVSELLPDLRIQKDGEPLMTAAHRLSQSNKIIPRKDIFNPRS